MKLRSQFTGVAITALVLSVVLPAARAEKVEQLRAQGYVNDFAGAIDAAARQQIAALCGEVDQKAHAQIAVVTIRSLEGDTPQDFANRLFKQWGVGYKPDDRGVLILLAVDDRKYWTEVGYGLEPILPDGKVGGFGREMLPLLRENLYGAALSLLTSRIAEVIAQDRGVTLSRNATPPPRQRRQGFPIPFAWIIFFGYVLVRLILWVVNLGGGHSVGRRGRWGGGWFPGGFIGTGGWGGGRFGGGGGGFGGFGGGGSGGGGAGGSW